MDTGEAGDASTGAGLGKEGSQLGLRGRSSLLVVPATPGWLLLHWLPSNMAWRTLLSLSQDVRHSTWACCKSSQSQACRGV